ncbi:hypothetical protein Q9Q99_13555 [Curtobacterium flaccumfaciens]|nr:hypothetical protein Q9Q99_13555 [Curtobacterium flaccumfaciens]
MSTEGNGGHDWVTWDAYHDAWRRLDRALDRAVQAGAGISVPEFEILIGLHRDPRPPSARPGHRHGDRLGEVARQPPGHADGGPRPGRARRLPERRAAAGWS